MTRQQLEMFCSVVRNGSFAKAALDCGVAQSTISREMLLLENEIRAPLFFRHNSGISLTPAGRLLNIDATSFLHLQDKILHDCTRISKGRLPTLDLSMSSRETVLMAPVLRELLQSGLEMPINCSNVKYFFMLKMLRNGDADAGVLLEEEACRLPGLVTVPLYREPWLVAARSDSPYWDMAPADRALLRDQIVLVSAENIGGREIDAMSATARYCLEHHLAYRHFLRANFYQDELLMLRSGLGVLLIPPFLAPTLPPEVRVSDELPEPFAPTFVLAYRSGSDHPGVRYLEALCRSHFGGALHG